MGFGMIAMGMSNRDETWTQKQLQVRMVQYTLAFQNSTLQNGPEIDLEDRRIEGRQPPKRGRTANPRVYSSVTEVDDTIDA